MSMINIDELHSETKRVLERKKKIYDTVLVKCHQRIKLVAKLNPLNSWCFYVIPKFIYGIPLYNLEECLNYIVTHLNKNGFTVNYTHPNLLFISWLNASSSKPKKSVTFGKNEYKSIDDYKPVGNLVYNQSSLNLLNKKTHSLLKHN